MPVRRRKKAVDETRLTGADAVSLVDSIDMSPDAPEMAEALIAEALGPKAGAETSVEPTKTLAPLTPAELDELALEYGTEEDNRRELAEVRRQRREHQERTSKLTKVDMATLSLLKFQEQQLNNREAAARNAIKLFRSGESDLDKLTTLKIIVEDHTGVATGVQGTL